MKRDPLKRLIEQARRVRDDAAVNAAGARRQVEQAQQTLDMLSNYLGEHLQRGRAKTEVDPALLHIRENFTRKLDTAIGEQTRQRAALQQSADAQRDELVDRQRRLLAFETLHARRAAARRLATERADQRHTDELATQRSRRRSGDAK